MASTNTRDRILGASLALFNAEGPATVSTNRIAAELGISPGNLHYHFRSKPLLIERLFTRFEAQMEPPIVAYGTVDALDDLWLTLHLTFETIDTYRFLFRDVEFVLRECPGLEARAKALVARNLAAVKAGCVSLADSKALVASEAAIELLALQFVFAMTGWYSFSRLVPGRQRRHGEASLGAYYCLSLLEPYVDGEAREYLNYLRAKYLK